MPGRRHAVGYLPFWARWVYRVPIVRVKDGALVRSASGLCEECLADEAGEVLGPLGNSSAADRFDGYTDAAETEQKIARDVFSVGDQWFRSGDIMTRDADGFFYFAARTGDNFRWKAENIAIRQIEAVVGRADGVDDACIIGVQVPGYAGRAPLATVVLTAAALANMQSFTTSLYTSK